MNLYMEFGKNLVLYVLRTQILIIIFFLSGGYFVFVFFIIFETHCDVFESFLHIFFHDLKLLSFFYIRIHCFFTILLIFFSYGEKVQFFIGKFFRRIIFPVPLKKIIALPLFISIISLLDSANTLILLILLKRIDIYELCVKQFSEHIKRAKEMYWGRDFLYEAIFNKNQYIIGVFLERCA